MIFVDTNVFMYAVGRPHPLRDPARQFFATALGDPERRLCTSSEVLHELLHVYLAADRLTTLDAALALVRGPIAEVWPVEAEDVWLARDLVDRHPGLQARDLVHLACCLRRDCDGIETYDRGLRAAFPA